MNTKIIYGTETFKTAQSSLIIQNAAHADSWLKAWITSFGSFKLNSTTYYNYFFLICEVRVLFFEKDFRGALTKQQDALLKSFIFFIQKHLKLVLANLIPVKIYLVHSRAFFLRYQLNNITNFVLFISKKVKNQSQLLANFICYHLEKTKKHKDFLIRLTNCLKKNRGTPDCFFIMVKGRLSGVDKTTTFKVLIGNNKGFQEKCFKTSYTPYGSIGISVCVTRK